MTMKKKRGKFIFWAPRILSILFALFLAVFSLDIFDMNLGFWGTAAGLMIHNIPSIALGIVIWISWKREMVGGVAFILAGLLYIIMLLIRGFEYYMLLWILMISGPAFLIGILFLINRSMKKYK
jgi:hypothetical protein